MVQAFVQFIGQDAGDMDARLRQQHLVEDKSPFKALGPVWGMGRQAPNGCAHDLADAQRSRSSSQYGQPFTFVTDYFESGWFTTISTPLW
jgi:hypothetical protein